MASQHDPGGEDASPSLASVVSQPQRPPVGASPGTLAPPPDALPTRLNVIAFGPEGLSETRPQDVAEVREIMTRFPLVWVDVQGLADISLLRSLAEVFGLHSLALEDVVHVHQRPKLETYGEHLFIVQRIISSDAPITTEQLALYVGPSFVVTFQEMPGDCFEPVRQRLRSGAGRLRQSGPDYLAYALIDAAIDAYFPVLERFGEAVEELEDEVIREPDRATAARLHRLRRDLLVLRRAIWPQREMVNALLREDTPVISRSTRVFLRDCYDHTVQLMDILETYREIASGLLDIYLSSLSARLNETMKVLTIIATIFIPLGFIASLYGMNFDTGSPFNMPELKWRYGYPFALALMLGLGLGLLYWFWRRGWLGEREGQPEEEAEAGRRGTGGDEGKRR